MESLVHEASVFGGYILNPDSDFTLCFLDIWNEPPVTDAPTAMISPMPTLPQLTEIN